MTSKHSKKAETAVEPLTVEPTAAGKEKDKEPKAVTFRVDLGESIPAQAPFPTATDNE